MCVYVLVKKKQITCLVAIVYIIVLPYKVNFPGQNLYIATVVVSGRQPLQL